MQNFCVHIQTCLLTSNTAVVNSSKLAQCFSTAGWQMIFEKLNLIEEGSANLDAAP